MAGLLRLLGTVFRAAPSPFSLEALRPQRKYPQVLRKDFNNYINTERIPRTPSTALRLFYRSSARYADRYVSPCKSSTIQGLPHPV